MSMHMVTRMVMVAVRIHMDILTNMSITTNIIMRSITTNITTRSITTIIIMRSIIMSMITKGNAMIMNTETKKNIMSATNIIIINMNTIITMTKTCTEFSCTCWQTLWAVWL